MQQIRFLRGKQEDLDKLLEKLQKESELKNETKSVEESDSKNEIKK